MDEYNRRHEVEALVATFGAWDMDTNEEIEAAPCLTVVDERSTLQNVSPCSCVKGAAIRQKQVEDERVAHLLPFAKQPASC